MSESTGLLSPCGSSAAVPSAGGGSASTLLALEAATVPTTSSYSPLGGLKKRMAEGSTETMSPGAKRVFALLC